MLRIYVKKKFRLFTQFINVKAFGSLPIEQKQRFANKAVNLCEKLSKLKQRLILSSDYIFTIYTN